MKILVTGPRGFVGARLMLLPGAVAAPSLRSAGQDDIRRLVGDVAPDVIVNTAAISDIGACAADPEGSRRANIDLPLMLAKTGVKCVMLSTDQVYGVSAGEGPFAEGDAKPENLYARHKLEMENRVLDIAPDAVLLRATWMYDMPLYGVPNRGNFLMNMLLSRRLSFSGTARRAVTYVRQVAALMERAACLPGGVYNYGSESDLTLLETARWLSRRLRLDVTLEDAGPRPSLWMDCERIRRHGICFDSAVEGLERCIRDYGL